MEVSNSSGRYHLVVNVMFLSGFLGWWLLIAVDCP